MELIDRDALLKIFSRYYGNDKIEVDEVMEWIEEQPDAQPKWAQRVEDYLKSAPAYIRNPLAWALYKTWRDYDR